MTLSALSPARTETKPLLPSFSPPPFIATFHRHRHSLLPPSTTALCPFASVKRETKPLLPFLLATILCCQLSPPLPLSVIFASTNRDQTSPPFLLATFHRHHHSRPPPSATTTLCSYLPTPRSIFRQLHLLLPPFATATCCSHLSPSLPPLLRVISLVPSLSSPPLVAFARRHKSLPPPPCAAVSSFPYTVKGGYRHAEKKLVKSC